MQSQDIMEVLEANSILDQVISGNTDVPEAIAALIYWKHSGIVDAPDSPVKTEPEARAPKPRRGKAAKETPDDDEPF